MGRGHEGASFDAVIVGAGPAGALTATLLARAGARILIVDSRPPGGDKPCGEGLLPRGVAALGRAGLGHLLEGMPALEAISLHFGAAGHVVPSGGPPDRSAARPLVVPFAGPPGRGARRVVLDARLMEAATSAGAALRLGTRVHGLLASNRSGPRVLLDGGGMVTARRVVIADGGRSSVGCTATAPRSGRRLGVVAHADAASMALSSRQVLAFLGASSQVVITPVGRGELSVAALLSPSEATGLRGGRGDGPARLRRWLRARLAAEGLVIEESALSPPRAVPLLGAAPRGGFAPGVVLVGDAAGAVDPVVGCGISLALESALREAPRILAALDGSTPVQGDDEELLEARTAALHRVPRAVASLLLGLARHPVAAGVAAALARSVPSLAGRILALAAEPSA